MSTAATAAAVAAAPKSGAAATPAATDPKKITTVPADVRRRILGMKDPPPVAPDKAAQEKAAADKAAADAKAAADKAAADAAAAAPAAGAAPAPDGIEKVKKLKSGPPLPEKPTSSATDQQSVADAVRQVLPEITRQAATDAAAATAASAAAIDPEVQREIEIAAHAAKKNPERYAGLADKVKTFYSSHDELLAAKAKELGGSRSSDFKDYLDSDEYKGWIAENRPTYARGDKAKFTEDMIAERARSEARREMEPELRRLERQTKALEFAPVIETKANRALSVIITDPSPQKDPALDGFAKDPMKFGEQHPEEAQIIAAEAAEGVELVREVYALEHNLVDFNPKAPTPRQAEITTFLRDQNRNLRQEHPQGIEMKDGTILIDADTYHDRGLSKDRRYRVFSADEIAGMIAATRNARVLDRLKRRREGITKSIYAPRQEAPAAAPSSQKPTVDDEPAAPAAGARAAPGSGGKSEKQKSLATKYG